MLRITFVNDRTGNLDWGNYNYTVSINAQAIQQGRIEGHNRKLGWEDLVYQLLIDILYKRYKS